MSKNAAGEIQATGLPSHRRPTHPGVILLEQFLREIPMTQAEAARRMNMPVTRVNELVRGRRGVTARSALRLGRLLGTTPMFWMNLQANWDLWHARERERQLRSANDSMSKPANWASSRAKTWPAMIDDAHLIRAEAEIENVLGVTHTWNEQPAKPLMPGDAYLCPVSRRLGLLAAEAHRRELLSEGQLARLLRLDRVDLRKILDAAGDIEGAADIECPPQVAEGPRRA